MWGENGRRVRLKKGSSVLGVCGGLGCGRREPTQGLLSPGFSAGTNTKVSTDVGRGGKAAGLPVETG